MWRNFIINGIIINPYDISSVELDSQLLGYNGDFEIWRSKVVMKSGKEYTFLKKELLYCLREINFYKE